MTRSIIDFSLPSIFLSNNLPIKDKRNSDFTFTGSSSIFSSDKSRTLRYVWESGAISIISPPKARPMTLYSASGSTMIISVFSPDSLILVVIISCLVAIPFPAPDVPKIRPDGVFNRLRSMVIILLDI